jgi:hypothetical protein
MQIQCWGRMKRSVCTNTKFVTVTADSYTQQPTMKQDNAMTDLFQEKPSDYSVELLTPVTFSTWVSTFRRNLLLANTGAHPRQTISLYIWTRQTTPLQRCTKGISKNQKRVCSTRGTRWFSWLRQCATSRKVAGSIPNGFIGIFHWHNTSGRTMAMGWGGWGVEKAAGA